MPRRHQVAVPRPPARAARRRPLPRCGSCCRAAELEVLGLVCELGRGDRGALSASSAATICSDPGVRSPSPRPASPPTRHVGLRRALCAVHDCATLERSSACVAARTAASSRGRARGRRPGRRLRSPPRPSSPTGRGCRGELGRGGDRRARGPDRPASSVAPGRGRHRGERRVRGWVALRVVVDENGRSRAYSARARCRRTAGPPPSPSARRQLAELTVPRFRNVTICHNKQAGSTIIRGASLRKSSQVAHRSPRRSRSRFTPTARLEASSGGELGCSGDGGELVTELDQEHGGDSGELVTELELDQEHADARRRAAPATSTRQGSTSAPPAGAAPAR
jgi:hypothetical protein